MLQRNNYLTFSLLEKHYAMNEIPSRATSGQEDPLAHLDQATEQVIASSEALYQEFIHKQLPVFDALGVNQVFIELMTKLANQPEKVLEIQQQAMNAWLDIWSNSMDRLFGGEDKPTPQDTPKDKRFRHDAWDSHPFFDLIRQNYLLTANTIQTIVSDVDGLDEDTAKKAVFYTGQFIDAMSPGNFILTNPEVIENTLSSNGQNLLEGLKNFCKDFDPDTGQLRIRMADLDAFELGRNVAVSQGKVIFQNRLMQLIQYSPSTTEVNQRPLLIIPPWINKYYILDLQSKNSLVKWLTEQGHTVFMISWVNPDESLREMDFQDYIFEGPLAALDAITQATGETEVNAIGYCIGGTLLSALLAYMQVKGDQRIVTATFMTTLIDFSDPGDLGVFIDEQQLSHLEEKMNSKGFHDGKDMAMTFNMLRANDLIWSFYINNYLLGKSPLEFDLLYWNSDSTRMPAKMHSTYLRSMYLENKFKEPGGITVGDVPVDLTCIRIPCYFISTEDDHIAPWRSTYLGAQLFSGPVSFVLGKSGHIAGIVNHPDAYKYGYNTGPVPEMDADEWHRQSQSHKGSWWPHWNDWIAPHAGKMVPASVPGQGGITTIENAPGSYVKTRT
jgi:polyhydroxyalkanoate synthase